jgi:hypothetical protein
MNLIKFKHRYDFGHEVYVQILNSGQHAPKWLKNRSALQISVSWNEQASWPYLQITSGSNSLLGILFWAYKFGFDIDVLSRTWNWDYMKEVDEKETEYLGMDEC